MNIKRYWLNFGYINLCLAFIIYYLDRFILHSFNYYDGFPHYYSYESYLTKITSILLDLYTTVPIKIVYNIYFIKFIVFINNIIHYSKFDLTSFLVIYFVYNFIIGCCAGLIYGRYKNRLNKIKI